MTLKFIAGVQYWFRPAEGADSCQGCVAQDNAVLCHNLGNSCHGGIWCSEEPPATVPSQPAAVKTTSQELQLFIRNYQQLAQAIQRAGGSVQLLETHTVPELLQTLARNSITLKATYDH